MIDETCGIGAGHTTWGRMGRPEEGRMFRAKFPGRCRACGLTFPAGPRLTVSKGAWRHIICPEARVASFVQMTPPVAPPVMAPVVARVAPTPERIADGINAELAASRAAAVEATTAPRPAWAIAMEQSPDVIAARAAAIRARREAAARALAEREAAEREAANRLPEMNSGALRMARVALDVFDGEHIAGFTPTPEPEYRPRPLDLD